MLVDMRIMSTSNTSKINQMLQEWVPGTVLTPTWLAKQGVSKDLTRRYVASGWLERIGRGAYMRARDVVDWQGAVHSIQTQLGLTVHVAGISALQLKGFGHYLPMGSQASVLLFSDSSERLPAWFLAKTWEVKIVHCCPHLLDLPKGSAMGTIEHKGFTILVSPPERAALELLYCIKDNAAFDHALTVFEGLGTLRPKEIQKLLQACRSVRVKRLFLWMARKCRHPWLKYLNSNAVNLGSGKRVVYEGGALDAELLITVPRQKGDNDV